MRNKIRSSLRNPFRSIFGLSLLAGFSLLVYIFAFLRPAPLTGLYGKAEPHFYKIFAPGSNIHLAVIFAFVLLAFFYGAALAVARQIRHPRAAWTILTIGSLAFSAVLLFMFPYDAADIFDYIIHGRMSGIYGDNPYRHTPKEYPQDPFLPFVAWTTDPSPYGPVWEILAGTAARLAGDNEILTILVYKSIPGFFYFASLFLLWLILKRADPERAFSRVLLLAWNPVVLYEVWGNGHNDMVMVFWILAAILAAYRGRYSQVFLFLTLGTLVKFIPALLFPVALVLALRAHPSFRSRLGFLVRTGAACLALAALLYAPFWFGPEAVTVLDRTSLYTSSIPAVIYHFLKASSVQDPAKLVSLLSLTVTVVFVIYLANWVDSLNKKRASWQAAVIPPTGENAGSHEPAIPGGWPAGNGSLSPGKLLAAGAFHILAFYLLFTIMWFQQWYTVWLIALAPLMDERSLRWFAVIFGFAALNKQLGIGPVLFQPVELKQPKLEFWFTLGVLGPPWLAAAWAYFIKYRSNRSRRA